MSAVTEIVDQHRFIQAWLRGTAGTEELGAFAETLTPDFALYEPDGTTTTLRKVLLDFEHAHGTVPGVEVEIRDARVLAAEGDLVVATYQEHQRAGEARNARRSTVVFTRDQSARHGLRWRHLHETWIAPPPDPTG